MKHLILVGFMGAGKSTTGQELAEQLNLPFKEIDKMIEKKCKMNIPQIFEQKGESYFREVEHEVLIDCLKNPSVIATGGGILTHNKSFELLKKAEKVIYLKGDSATLLRRIKHDDLNKRPLADSISNDTLIKRLKEREQAYNQVANLIINIEAKTVEEITLEVQNNVKGQ